ncbi:MAG: YicC family protein [Gammaproteobacteria bacterium]|nr:MAG: YicC family protein [Gammaproteobacteria bacterium]
MIYSMTGFSRVQADSDMGTLSIEIKSVNSRYLDIFFKMPESLKAFENDLRKQLSTRLARGKIECNIRFYAAAKEQLSINEEYVTALLSASKKLAQTHQINDVGMGELLRLPGVLVETPADTEALKTWLMPFFQQAVDALLQQRQSEGEHLKQLVDERLSAVLEIIEQVKNNYQQSVDKVKDKLHGKLDELAQRYQSRVDEQRFEQEMIYLLQKMDIAEEIDRLQGHIAEVNKLFHSDAAVGRKLDFLMQEMNRESNTIAAKAQNLGVTLNAVELKVLLEQMREQIQNIE